MNTYIVSITKEICSEFEIVAKSPKEAEFIALRKPSSSQCRMLSDDWCEGHLNTRKAVVIEEVEG
jgi:hypothetical protein